MYATLNQVLAEQKMKNPERYLVEYESYRDGCEEMGINPMPFHQYTEDRLEAEEVALELTEAGYGN